MSDSYIPSPAELRKAAKIRERIEDLEAEYAKLVVSASASARGGGAAKAGKVPKKRNLSPEARARIVAAQKRRWAKVRRAAKKG